MSNEAEILLSKWMDGSATPEDIRILKDQYDLEYLHQLLSAQQSYTLDSVDDETMWNDFKETQTIKAKSKTPYLIGGLFILILSSFILYTLFKNNDTKVETKSGDRQQIALIDGSSIALSPQSVITYNEKNWQKARTVRLEGQASFNISTGIPFIVETKSGNIEVLGTSFDVWSIDADFLTVKCTEGKVSVSNGVSKTIIIGGEQVQINQKILSKNKAYQRNKPDWQDNLREYENLPLHLVLFDLSRFYEVDFKLKSNSSKDLFSGVIPIDDLDKTLRYLQRSTSYEYSTEGSNYIFAKE